MTKNEALLAYVDAVEAVVDAATEMARHTMPTGEGVAALAAQHDALLGLSKATRNLSRVYEGKALVEA